MDGDGSAMEESVVANFTSLVLLPALPPPSPPSLRLLQPLTLPRVLFLPAPSVDIARKDKYFRNKIGRGVPHWLVAGGSAPCRKCRNRPLAVVRDSILRPLFLHHPQ